MVDRLRVLLEEPLDPRVGRAIVVLASAIVLGFAALFVLAAHESDTRVEAPMKAQSTSDPPPAELERTPVEGAAPAAPRRRQDPQDQKGSIAARRAARALASHRVLQHVPYRSGELKVDLVGARGHRAVLRVSANTVQTARASWPRLLRRYRDSGRAYIAIFRGKDGKRNG
ncbi:MAG TPA: hypothetical protein VH275_04855 [Solirubrobacterales bacterium]|jgi:hypothetical protein|nr:hypothetical protein [Solirubrobacterales bacterium]